MVEDNKDTVIDCQKLPKFVVNLNESFKRVFALPSPFESTISLSGWLDTSSPVKNKLLPGYFVWLLLSLEEEIHITVTLVNFLSTLGCIPSCPWRLGNAQFCICSWSSHLLLCAVLQSHRLWCSGGTLMGQGADQWKTSQRKHWIILKPFCDLCCTFSLSFFAWYHILFTRDTCIYFVKFFKALTCLEKIFLLPSSSNSYFHFCSYVWCFCIVLKWTVPTFTLHTLSDILEFFLIFLWVVLFPAFVFAEGIYHEAFCMTSFSSWWLLLKFHYIQLEKYLSLNK